MDKWQWIGCVRDERKKVDGADRYRTSKGPTRFGRKRRDQRGLTVGGGGLGCATVLGTGTGLTEE